MMRKLLLSICSLAFLLGSARAHAGGSLEVFDITGFVPSERSGEIIARPTRVRWDPRCIPVNFVMNNTLDPIPNPLGAPFLTLAQASATVSQAFSTWNQIPTSYFEMRLTGTRANPGLPGYDFVNEVTFRRDPTFGEIAFTQIIGLMQDENLTNGRDIDEDGDPDVSSAITTCADVDHDGDIELPAGFYPAGTTLDTDILFSSDLYRFTITTAAADTNRSSVDLLGVATHEAGHALGLSHVLENQLADNDGTGNTMYPTVDTDDPASELSLRTLGEDEIGYASFYYPEGTASSGPAALQTGDLPFSLFYGTVRGSVRQGELGGPLAGASVSAINLLTGRVTGAAFSGHTQVSVDLSTGVLDPIRPGFAIRDGKYEIPLPLGLYELRIEAVDGNPLAPLATNPFSVLIGDFFGQQTFLEESFNGGQEDESETRPGRGVPVVVIPSLATSGKDFVTNVQRTLGTNGPFNVAGFDDATAGTYFASRIPASAITAAASNFANRDLTIQAGEMFTFVFDSSVVPKFAEVMLATGTVSGTTATIDLAHPLRRESGFVGQDRDFAPFYFSQPQQLTKDILRGISRGEIQNLFLVLRLPTTTPFPGISGRSPRIGVSAQLPIVGNSYRSSNGTTFTRQSGGDYLFRLVYTVR